MSYFIDTNIFLRVLVKEDEQSFEECYRFLKLLEENKIRAVTSGVVLAEVDWVLESFYNFSKEKTIEALEGISKLPRLGIKDKINLPLALEFYKKYEVKFIDALIASIPQIQNKQIIIVSYDKDFDKLEVERVEPGGIVKKLG